MAKKNQKKSEKLAKKAVVESLEFQAHWGLKLLGFEDGISLHQILDEEIAEIAELNLASDLLKIKNFVEKIEQNFAVKPTPEKGDFAKSLTAIGLGFARVENLENLGVACSWREFSEQKLLAIYFPEAFRNKIIDFAAQNGYQTSTHLGDPIIKFRNLWLALKRDRE